MLAPNTILQNRYRVVRELGHGGMGTVYEALDQRVNCIIALKETSVDNNDEARNAFEREAALLANLRHSALPKVMDYFSEGDGDFLVMEFIPGYDLAELLELRGSPFPQAQVLRWADELLKVLEYLHRQQPPVLHRDIKPSNLKLTKQGEIFLLDFGLAKGTAGQMPTLMTSRSVRGYTPVYAALEQIHGQGTDPRSDLYSLSATLYHLLTGVTPTDAPTRFSIIEDEQPDPLQPIERLNPQCSSGVTAIIHQGMSINRRKRPAGAAEMRKALRQAAEEDERGAAEEEYRRAEENRNRRDAERRQAEEKALRQAEEEREGQEAETRKVEQERRQQAERRQREEEAARLAETERRRLEEVERQRREAVTAERIRAEKEQQRRTNLLVTNPANQLGMELVYVPAGSFMMGSNNKDADEEPVHEVTIKEGFYMGRYEVTQAEWQQVMGNNPSEFKGDNLPVEQVSWDDAQNFIRKLNERGDGFKYRLPTEAEWEYACRAGTTGDYAGDVNEMAWYSENSESKTHAVGGKRPNSWGLADMHGNVWEWCADYYHETYYGAPTDGSAWLTGGDMKYRVLRGGSWGDVATGLRSANRLCVFPAPRSGNGGVRVVAIARTQ